MLTNNEVELFRRAVDKAVENGYKHPSGELQVNNKGEIFVYLKDSEVQAFGYATAQNNVIFNHDFAKAVWPDDKDGNVYWRMHLQRMVVSGNPIKYLGENYNDVN